MLKFSELPYERVDFAKAIEEIKALTEQLGQCKSAQEQFEVHKKYYKLSDEIATQSTIASIRHSIDTTDEFYNAEQDYYDEQFPLLNPVSVAYQSALYHSPYREELEQIIGKVAFKNIELSMKSVDERIVPLMQEENALTTEYDKLIAGAKIEWEGEILNVSLMTPYLTHQDQEVRKRAWEKYDAFFASVAAELDEIFDKLVKVRTKQARELGYENYLELGYYRMQRNCYDQKMVERFRNQVKQDFVPYAQKLHERRRERLGIKELHCYDNGVYFTEGNPKPLYGPEEILNRGLTMYTDLSPQTSEFMKYMMEGELFDVIGRKTKKAGGYMTYLPNYGSPFVFANFNGTSGDVDVITHECGHAFQGYLSGKDPIREHADITMETAEIHSMSMEFFTEPYMDMFFGERSKDYIDMHLESCAAFIPYGTMVDEFQHIVYANPDMTPAERNAAWAQLEKEYQPHLNYEGYPFFMQGRYWQRQLHIYDYPLYYIDYVLAQSCAFQYKAWMDQDRKAAWESYVKLCELSASDFFTGLLAQVGLDDPFEEGSMKKLVENLK